MDRNMKFILSIGSAAVLSTVAIGAVTTSLATGGGVAASTSSYYSAGSWQWQNQQDWTAQHTTRTWWGSNPWGSSSPAPVPTRSPSPSPSSTPTPTVTPTPTPSPSPTSPPATPPAAGSPSGVPGTWTLKFADEFNGSAVDTSKWSYRSTAESDWSSNPVGTGNLGNQQLEFDQPGNCTVSGGLLDMVAKPDSVTSSSGKHYNYSSCMINSSPSYSFRYGYVEFRAAMPAVKGYWPALWTWGASGTSISGNGETDAVEVYTDNQFRVYQTQHNSGGGGGVFTLPSGNGVSNFHTYGVDIEPSGTTWYVDGRATNHTATTSGGNTNILVDDFVYSQIPPAAGSVGHLKVDFVRAYAH